MGVGCHFLVGSLAPMRGKGLTLFDGVFMLHILVIFCEPRKRCLDTLPIMGFNRGTPHSLGKLIEWKRNQFHPVRWHEPTPPHSLGKLIEWKPH